MELTNKQEKIIGEFYKHLGTRFPKIEASTEGAPISICATDVDGNEYWIRLVDNLTESVLSIEHTGTKIDNKIFYQLYALVSNDKNVFHMEIFKDGYALWFINEISPEQLKVTEEFTMIGITSALHVELPSFPIPTVTGSFNLN